MNRHRYTAHRPLHTCEVLVSNVGLVYQSLDCAEASDFFDHYVKESLTGDGRAGDETVTLLKDGEIARQFVGALDVVTGWQEAGFTKTDARRHARFDEWRGYPPEFKRRLIALVDDAEWW